MLFSSNSNNQLIKGLIESYFCNQNRSGFTFSLCLVKLVPNTETETFPVNKCSLSDLNSNISLHLYMWRWGISSRKKVECFVITSVKISPLSRFQTPYHHLETQISLYHHHKTSFYFLFIESWQESLVYVTFHLETWSPSS